MQKKSILISSCLLGEKVRYDGRDKKNDFVLKHIAPYHQIITFCPEMNMGLGAPRPKMNLFEDSGIVKLFDENVDDLTIKAIECHRYYLGRIEHVDIAILKSKSPSCGYKTTPIIGSNDLGNGLFVVELLKCFPKVKIYNEIDLTEESVKGYFLSLKD